MQAKAKLFLNPYTIYSLGFLGVLALYPLGWSDLYPNLSSFLVIFIIISSILSFLVGLRFHEINYFAYSTVNFSTKKIWLFTFLILLSYVAEFYYHRLIPLVAILRGSKYDYTQFGIPSFHVLVVIFNSFWAVFVFHNIQSQKKKSLYLAYLLCIIPPILIFNRGMFMMILASSIFILLMATNNIKKILIRVLIFLFFILFLFGIAGNVRFRGGTASGNSLILKIGMASNNFKNSIVPDQFFWSYLYITSPLANAQKTLDNRKNTDLSVTKIAAFFNSEILPDFISKRNEYLVKFSEPMIGISKAFTVGSVYAKSCAYFGNYGLLIMYLYILFFNLVVIIMLNPKSKFFITGVATLNSIMLFNIFDNMFHFAGLVLQLVFPIVFGGLAKASQILKVNTKSLINNTA